MRRSSGSRSVIFRSGRTRASGIPGRPAAGAHVAHGDALRHDLGQHGAVQDVPLPQPGHFPGTDETTLHPRVGQQLRVPDRVRVALAEYRSGLFRSRGKLCCLRHVDRPSVPRYRVGGLTIRLTKIGPACEQTGP